MDIELPAPCRRCGGTTGRVVANPPHMELRCSTCDAHIKFVPKAELGLPTRSTASCGMRPKDRVAVLEKFGHRCALCGRGPIEGIELHMGHLVSRRDGERFGIDTAVIDHPYNRAPMCEECNGGLGSRTVAIQLMARCIHIHLRSDETRGPSQANT